MNSADPATRPVRLAVLGAGNRGQKYLGWAREHQDQAVLAAVADPLATARKQIRDGFADVAEFPDWRDLMAAVTEGTLEVDAVLVTTQDRDHVEPCLAVADAGLPLLAEKPLGVSKEECLRIVEAIRRSGILFAVGHVMRYTPYTELVRKVIESGRLGRIISVHHLEPVGWWHAAHSFVRGNWRNTATASPMLLAKSCHDIDWIMYVTGKSISTVSSFGSLAHFRADEAPQGAGDRCLDCAVEPTCPYSAKKIYIERPQREGRTSWLGSVVTRGEHEADLVEALRTGPYGRCVYKSDNDVVDNQVVSMQFDDGTTGSFTMTAFSEHTGRRTQIFGTQGCLDGDGKSVELFDFVTNEREHLAADVPGSHDAGGGHGGGDAGLMSAFVAAVATGDRQYIRSGVDETLASHLSVFAAEESRLQGTVVAVEGPAEITP
ncbi:Gfo/Idh/MocA family protein [Ruania albidiflava]|uniref:Gfo/Idh/MocA family protein n=1 Tax=Ruania albidiflava TaxID=366586 RepID=UPI0003B33BBF|nr:Gfo/Idh/MocA family oxidoreductase [Ruania albidiflava]